MQNNKDSTQKKQPDKPTPEQYGLSHVPANATLVHAASSAKKDPKTGATIPEDHDLESASHFIRENKL